MKIKDTFSLIPGLLQQIDNPVWIEEYNSMDLDLEFLTTYGEREISPLVNYFAKDKPVTEEDAAKIISVVYRKYKESWSRQLEILTSQYDMLTNYSVLETEKRNVQNTSSDNRTENRIEKNNSTLTDENTRINDRNINDELKRTGSDTTTFENVTVNKEGTVGNSNNTQTDNLTDTLSYIDRKDSETRNLKQEKTSNDLTTDNTSSTLSFENRKDSETRNLTKDEHTSGSTTDNSSSTLSFENRKDSETRNLTKSGETTGNETDTKSSTLSFDGRRDSQNRDITTTNGNTKVEEGKNEEKGNSRRDGHSDIFGFNSISAVPAQSNGDVINDGKTITANNRMTDDGTSKETGIVSDTKTGSEKTQNAGGITSRGTSNERDGGTISNDKSGSEKTQNAGGTNSLGSLTGTDKGTVSSDKTGSEKTQNSGTLNAVGNATDKDTGTISKDMTGSEKNVKSGTISNVENSSNTLTGNLKENTNQTVVHNTTDANTSTGKETSALKGTQVNEGDRKEDIVGKNDTVGELVEERTFLREGDIGVSTATQLMQLHIDFWKENSIVDNILKDVADMLTTSVYVQ